MQTWRHADLQTWRHADMETCRHEDMETCRYGDMKTWRHVDMETCRHGDMQIWRHTYIVYCTRSVEFDAILNYSSSTDCSKQKTIQHRASTSRLSVYTPNRQIGQCIFMSSYTLIRDEGECLASDFVRLTPREEVPAKH